MVLWLFCFAEQWAILWLSDNILLIEREISMRKEKWIITVYNSEDEVSSTYLINDNERGVRTKMVEMMKEQADNHTGVIEDCGAEYPEDIDFFSEENMVCSSVNRSGLNAVIRYDDHHVSYTAVRLADVVKL
jgi:hypothetical protein